MIRTGIFLLGWLLATPAMALEFPGGRIDIPTDFDGPIADQVDENTKVYAFRKRNAEGQPDAQLQLTIWNPSRDFSDLPADQMENLTRHYLLEFFGGLKRTRDDVQGHTPDFIEIAGVPTARMDWEGSVSGEAVRGTFYALFHDSRLILLHSQDLAESETDHFDRITSALESMRLDNSGPDD